MAWYIFNIWQNIKSYLPGACGDRTELDHFAKHGHNKADTEMSSFRYDEDGEQTGQTEHKIAGTEDYDSDYQPNGPVSGGGGGGFEGEFGGKGSEIDEWQAGWNVTNAIQVTYLLVLT